MESQHFPFLVLILLCAYPTYVHNSLDESYFFKKNEFINLFITFVPSFKGTVFSFMTPERPAGQRITDGWLCWCTLIRQPPTHSRDAYRPLRGCLTAGEMALARTTPPRILYISFHWLVTEMPMFHNHFSFWGSLLIFWDKRSIIMVFSRLQENGKKNVFIIQ